MLRWEWDKPIGKITWRMAGPGDMYETRVFRGNAMIICINESWKNGERKGCTMGLFIVDKGHFKNICNDKNWNFAEDMLWAEFWDLNSETWSFVKELHRRGIPVNIRDKA